jgi:hypothetical protein
MGGWWWGVGDKSKVIPVQETLASGGIAPLFLNVGIETEVGGQPYGLATLISGKERPVRSLWRRQKFIAPQGV